jgi:hypothetical protein
MIAINRQVGWTGCLNKECAFSLYFYRNILWQPVEGRNVTRQYNSLQPSEAEATVKPSFKRMRRPDFVINDL